MKLFRWLLLIIVVIHVALWFPSFNIKTTDMIQSTTAIGTRVITKHFDGVIAKCPKEVVGRKWGCWSLTHNVIIDLETRIPDFVDRKFSNYSPTIVKELPQYKRYYEGIVRNVQREIDVSFIHQRILRDMDWLNQQIEIMDGGDLAFDLQYNFDEHRIIFFEAHYSP
jgi:hypothetical protein